jgi:8-oxo-dGTP pyrophosphatase MutT (NUDIX family)
MLEYKESDYKMKYVICVATTADKIVLVKKNKPAWQAGKFNFVGGKIEPGESIFRCAEREFEEETGVPTDITEWRYVGCMYRPGDFYCAILQQQNPHFDRVKTMESEEIVLMDKNNFEQAVLHYPENFMSNLGWIYGFTKSDDFKKYTSTIELEFKINEA